MSCCSSSSTRRPSCGSSSSCTSSPARASSCAKTGSLRPSSASRASSTSSARSPSSGRCSRRSPPPSTRSSAECWGQRERLPVRAVPRGGVHARQQERRDAARVRRGCRRTRPRARRAGGTQPVRRVLAPARPAGLRHPRLRPRTRCHQGVDLHPRTRAPVRRDLCRSADALGRIRDVRGARGPRGQLPALAVPAPEDRRPHPSSGSRRGRAARAACRSCSGHWSSRSSPSCSRSGPRSAGDGCRTPISPPCTSCSDLMPGRAGARSRRARDRAAGLHRSPRAHPPDRRGPAVPSRHRRRRGPRRRSDRPGAPAGRRLPRRRLCGGIPDRTGRLSGRSIVARPRRPRTRSRTFRSTPGCPAASRPRSTNSTRAERR